jgi:hypothetical protein
MAQRQVQVQWECSTTLPTKAMDDDKAMIGGLKGYRPCRDGGSGRCVHCSAGAAKYAEMLPQGVDGQNTWALARATNRRLDRDSFADEMPVRGHPTFKKGKVDASNEDNVMGEDVPSAQRSLRSMYCPFDPRKVAEIDLGPKSTVHRPKFDEYVAAKREHLKRKHPDAPPIEPTLEGASYPQ